ncbi:MAG: hypothetical protein LIO79_09965 [Rikenellaceae bacterium]|nr:hypothetical protein [Rikenellaceae bacterium]
MKTKLLLFGLLLIIPQHLLKAQEKKSTIDLLTAHVWESSENANIPEYDRYRQFTREKMKTTVVLEDRTVTAESYYYLTDSRDERFDMDKVGKCENGKYIYFYNPDSDMANLLLIYELTDEKLNYITIQEVFFTENNGHDIREIAYNVYYPKKE